MAQMAGDHQGEEDTTYRLACSMPSHCFEDSFYRKNEPDKYVQFVESKDLGKIDAQSCPHCGAHLFKKETPSLCCGKGKIKLARIPDPPPLLASLLTNTHRLSKEFQAHIRAWNNAFAMASLQADPVPFMGGGAQCYKVKGRMAHRVNTSIGHPPPEGQRQRYMQIYFSGPGGLPEREARDQEAMPGLDRDLMLNLQEMLHECNPFILRFKTLLEMDGVDEGRIVIRSRSHLPPGQHARTWNAPTADEVAVILQEGDLPLNKQDLIVNLRQPDPQGRRTQNVPAIHCAYDALHYVLMFPHGSQSWHLGGHDEEGKPTMCKWYKFHLHVRPDSLSHILRCKMLFQQWIAEAWARVQKGQLDWVKTNQKELRAEKYKVRIVTRSCQLIQLLYDFCIRTAVVLCL